MNNLVAHLRHYWSALRRLCGDDAYDRYLEHHRRQHAGHDAPLTREDFYRRETERRWNGVKRCC